MRRKILLIVIPVFLPMVILFNSCESIKIVDENEGILKLTLLRTDETKAVVRGVPDSNSFVLSVKNSLGSSIYNGKYGERPADFSIPAGTYDVEVNSIVFTVPEFETPLYRDSKTVVVESGKVAMLSLLCKQTNSGLRLKFSQNFLERFSGYIPQIADSKGKKSYPFNETRFLYFNPGTLKMYLLNNSNSTDTVKLMTKTVAANSMLTINLDVLSEGSSGVVPGIKIDTTSVWEYSEFIYGSEKEGDGLTNLTPFLVSQVASKIGLTAVWVSGYIVGGDLSSSSAKFAAPFTSETNVAIAGTPGVTDRTLCISVSLPSGTIRNALNLVANPGNLGKRVWIKGNIVASYFGLNGLNPVTEFKLE
jgi:hypothetical protein